MSASRGRRMVGSGLTVLTAGAAALVMGMLALILRDIVRGGAARLSWEFLTAAPDQGMTAGGIFPAIYGTAVMTILMTVAVMPVGVLTAVYLHEYAPSASRLVEAIFDEGTVILVHKDEKIQFEKERLSKWL